MITSAPLSFSVWLQSQKGDELLVSGYAGVRKHTAPAKTILTMMKKKEEREGGEKIL